MKPGLVLRRVAAQEFDRSIGWYEKKQKGLGTEFRAAIEGYFVRIVDHPDRFPRVRGEVRRAVVRRFPFVIHFLAERERVIILSVFHTSRGPEELRFRR